MGGNRGSKTGISDAAAKDLLIQDDACIEVRRVKSEDNAADRLCRGLDSNTSPTHQDSHPIDGRSTRTLFKRSTRCVKSRAICSVGQLGEVDVERVQRGNRKIPGIQRENRCGIQPRQTDPRQRHIRLYCLGRGGEG